MKKLKVVAALIRRGDKIFVTQRGYGDMKGGWEFPGGKIKAGETAQEALVREIEEELDTEVSVGMLYDTVEYDYPDFHLSMQCFWCSIIRGNLTLKEHMDAKWLSQEELEEVNWLPADIRLVRRLKEEGFAIRNLVFDVGHVLLEYRWKEMFMENGLSEEDAIRVGEEIFSAPFWTDRFDRGTIDWEGLVEMYRDLYPDDIEYIRWFLVNGKLMRGKDRPEIWDRIHTLKEQGYHLYILSNYSKYLFDLHTEDAPFMSDMDGMVVSYEPNLIKPEPEIYYYLRDKYDLKLSECLFFDDRLENVQKAHDLGMDAVWVSSDKVLEDTLEALIDHTEHHAIKTYPRTSMESTTQAASSTNTIIFDLGNVLVHFQWRQVLYSMGYSLEEAEHIGDAVFKSDLWDQFDYGIMDGEEIIRQMKLNTPEIAEDIDWIWQEENFKRLCKMLPYSKELLSSLHQKGYKIYILSNYGERLLNLGRESFTFFDDVDGEVVSYQVKSIKPEGSIYEALIRKYNIKPGEAVFFDDKKDNCEKATEYGIAGVQVGGLEEIIEGLLEHFDEDYSYMRDKYPHWLRKKDWH